LVLKIFSKPKGFSKFLSFFKYVGVMQVFSPYGRNSYGLKETKRNTEKVEASLFMVLFRKERFKMFERNIA